MYWSSGASGSSSVLSMFTGISASDGQAGGACSASCAARSARSSATFSGSARGEVVLLGRIGVEIEEPGVVRRALVHLELPAVGEHHPVVARAPEELRGAARPRARRARRARDPRRRSGDPRAAARRPPRRRSRRCRSRAPARCRPGPAAICFGQRRKYGTWMPPSKNVIFQPRNGWFTVRQPDVVRARRCPR